MEKTLELVLNNEKAVVQDPQEFFENDYDKEIFEKVISALNNDFAKEYVIQKYEEYTKVGFPKWKRLNFNTINLPKYNYKNYLTDLNKENLELINKYDFEGSHRKFVLLSDIFSSKGAFFKIDNDKVIINKYSDEITNNFYKVTGNLTLIRIIKNEQFTNNTDRFIVENGSTLNVYNLYFTNENSFGSSNVFIWAKNNSNVKVRDFITGNGKFANYLGVKMNEKNSNVDIKPYFLGNKKAIFDMLYLLRFIGEDNKGEVKAIGALSDESKIVFRGILDIKRGAKNTEASEEERCILLSENSKMEAIPSLLVDENEIVASHAASSSPIDEDSLFYLMSRGFSRAEAKNSIIKGIFESLIIELSQFNLEEMVKNAITQYQK